MEAGDFRLWKIEFTWQMREFKRDLYRHFEVEDESAIFDHYPITESKKGLFGLTIRKEHARMIIDFEKIFNRLKKINSNEDPRLKKFESAVKKLIFDIQAHESKEREVLSQISQGNR